MLINKVKLYHCQLKIHFHIGASIAIQVKFYTAYLVSFEVVAKLIMFIDLYFSSLNHFKYFYFSHFLGICQYNASKQVG